jgi:hypothetical protein
MKRKVRYLIPLLVLSIASPNSAFGMRASQIKDKDDNRQLVGLEEALRSGNLDDAIQATGAKLTQLASAIGVPTTPSPSLPLAFNATGLEEGEFVIDVSPGIRQAYPLGVVAAAIALGWVSPPEISNVEKYLLVEGERRWGRRNTGDSADLPSRLEKLQSVLKAARSLAGEDGLTPVYDAERPGTGAISFDPLVIAMAELLGYVRSITLSGRSESF